MKAGRRVLVVAAHPDDEVLGCGATMARRAAAGERVRTLILGEGAASRPGLSAREKRRLVARLEACAREANRLLGAEKLTLARLPDNALDTIPLLSVVRKVEAAVEEFRPEVIYTHHAGDLNVDHRIAADAVRTACRPLPGSPVREILAFEVPSSTEWSFGRGTGFEPDVFSGVGRFLDAKIRALGVYESEARRFPHPRSEDYVRSLAKVRGGQSGVEAAEAFMLVRRLDP